MTPELQKILDDIRPIADKLRAALDTGDKIAVQFDTTILGRIAEKLPEVGQMIQTLLAAFNLLDSGMDALDGVIDAYDTPAKVTELPQVSRP